MGRVRFGVHLLAVVLLVAVVLLAVVLLVVVAGPVSATVDGQAPGVVSTAQSDIDPSPESDTEPRLVARETSERVDAVVIALWSIAAAMSVMLVLFLWHTSPRRRLRLARRRSIQLDEGEAAQAEGMAGSGPPDGAEVVGDVGPSAAGGLSSSLGGHGS